MPRQVAAPATWPPPEGAERRADPSPRHPASDPSLPLRGVIDGLGPSLLVGLLTTDGVLVEVNRAALQATGFTREEVVGTRLADLPVWPEGLQERLTEVVARGGRGEASHFELEILTKDRVPMVIDFSLEPVRDDRGQVLCLVPSAVVVTARKEVEATLRRANTRLRALSRQLLEVREAERRQLARELHDEIGQVLSAAKISLQGIQHALREDGAAERLADTINIIDRGLEQVRFHSLELRPPLLDDFGLQAALRWLVGRQARRSGLTITFDCPCGDARFQPETETACFRVAQEALTNVIRHARAARVAVSLRERKGWLHLRVRDDGGGFDVHAGRAAAARGDSLGLLGMEERTSLAGGAIHWRSTRGRGTLVHAWFPGPGAAASAGRA